MMAVAETAGAQGKSASGETPENSASNQAVAHTDIAQAATKIIAITLLSLPLLAPLQTQAQIRADASAPSNQQPQIVTTANGLPQVNIQAPSAPGSFIGTWMRLTAEDPQFVQYQMDALINRNLYPVVQELAKAGVDFRTLDAAQKEMLFSGAVQHGAGVQSKTKGLDNVLERTFAQADTELRPPSLPTYTRKDLVYGEVEERMQEAEKEQAKLVVQRESLVVQQQKLERQRESLVVQQLELERQRSKLLESGLGASDETVQSIKAEVQFLDRKVNSVTTNINDITPKIDAVTPKVDAINTKIGDQQADIKKAAEYLKDAAKSEVGSGEKFIKDFYKERTEMYPKEAKRYQQEMESILKQYREEQKAVKQKK